MLLPEVYRNDKLKVKVRFTCIKIEVNNTEGFQL
jgi:hypothetical protein